MIYYLTGAERAETRAVAAQGYALGVIAQPDSNVHMHAHHYPVWAVDNGCFAKGDKFNLDKYLTWLAALPHRGHCIFATAPDVLGDATATWQRSAEVLPTLRQLGYNPALVAQDGWDGVAVDWSAFDVLFLGGSDAFKLGPAGERATCEAVARGKWVHMGRVNSYKRLKLAHDWGCDSADGTYIKYAPFVNIPNVVSWLERINGPLEKEQTA